jgi:hypothetical protein
MGGEFRVGHGNPHFIQAASRRCVVSGSSASSWWCRSGFPGSIRRFIGAVDAGEVLEIAARAFL